MYYSHHDIIVNDIQYKAQQILWNIDLGYLISENGHIEVIGRPANFDIRFFSALCIPLVYDVSLGNNILFTCVWTTNMQ